MKVHDIICEANVLPDAEFLGQLSVDIDDALEEYQEYLDTHNDMDNINHLEDLLNATVDEELRIDFTTNYNKTNSDWWMSAEATTGETEDGERVTDFNIILNARNMIGVYGPKTFKKMLMRLVSHELVHKGQHARIPDLNKVSSGYQKAADAKTHRDWQRMYLRDPHELMAYGETLAQEISDTDDPAATLRNPEAYMEQLPTYARFRQSFPRDAKQIKSLLKYTSQYLK
jgi:hypothetical protein